MTLPLDEISTETLVRESPGSHTLVGEMSSVGQPRLRRVFDDACDVGIHVRSHRTGTVKTFILATIGRSDTDIHAWEFVEYPTSIAPLRLILLND